MHLYYSSGQINKNEVGGACSAIGELHVRFLLGNPMGKRSLGKAKYRWEDNINTDLYEMLQGVLDWIDLTQDRERWQVAANSVLNLRVP